MKDGTTFVPGDAAHRTESADGAEFAYQCLSITLQSTSLEDLIQDASDTLCPCDLDGSRRPP